LAGRGKKKTVKTLRGKGLYERKKKAKTKGEFVFCNGKRRWFLLCRFNTMPGAYLKLGVAKLVAKMMKHREGRTDRGRGRVKFPGIVTALWGLPVRQVGQKKKRELRRKFLVLS